MSLSCLLEPHGVAQVVRIGNCIKEEVRMQGADGVPPEYWRAQSPRPERAWLWTCRHGPL